MTTNGKNTRATETSDYVAMYKRLTWRLGERIAEDPVLLAHAKDIQDTLSDAINWGIWRATKDPATQPKPYSQQELADIAGTSQQNMSKRAKRGEEVHVRLEILRGEGALVRIADVRADRAAVLAEAEVADRTGSERERAALPATGTDGAAVISPRFGRGK